LWLCLLPSVVWFLVSGFLVSGFQNSRPKTQNSSLLSGLISGMGKRDPRVDAYIAKSADFAKPILEYIRETVHAAIPDVEETMKWSFPHFDYRGVICGMASFKEHCAFGFWKAELVLDEVPAERDAMGHMGRVTSVKDLPPKKEFTRLLKKAAKLNEEGVKVERVRKKKPSLETPPDLAAALKKSKKASSTWDGFAPSHRREYIEWIIEAKTDATRQKRLAQAIEWIADGKQRNWKYMK
jgi:uncharacterized protein YdeI (YjbR/CyaY-like superfamily)